ncbi:MAG: prolyl oligopeptidase family serine peptidase [Opitutaceae bacterium]|nr:prolyl oligopeptidase family serine peptidase [Opitutaceae bacterium]
MHLTTLGRCRKLFPVLGAFALALTLPHRAAADKLDLERITPVPSNESIPVADFFRLPLMSSPTLNLSGTHIAALVSGGEDRTNLMVYELKTKKIETIGLRGDTDIYTVSWLNADRLVFGISIQKRSPFSLCAAEVGKLNYSYPLLQNVGSTLIAVPPKDRLHPLFNLMPNTGNTGKYAEAVTVDAKLSSGGFLDFTGMETMLSGADLDKVTKSNQHHILIRHPILETPDGLNLYYLADKEGRLAFGITSTKGVSTLHQLAGEKWVRCPEDLDEIKVIGSGEKPGEIVVLGARQGGKPRPLQFMNAADGTPGEVLVQDPAYDADGRLYRDPVSQDIVGVYYDRVGPEVVWFSEAYRNLQKVVDRQFPGLMVRIINTDETGKMVLLRTFSDRQPETYHWVDLENHTAGLIQNSRPWIDPHRMQPMSTIKFKTRDGRRLDAYVTLPAGASKQNPSPLVVLPPTTFGERNTWGFNAEVQFLASRGYTVLQPNCRGSSGYHWMFPVADEWAFRKMSDDVTDATKALLESGFVDRNRVAILGTGFGGYLALSGAAYDPTLYRCVVAISPMTLDWEKMIEECKYAQFSSTQYDLFLRKLGDPKKEPEKFDAIAPLRHAGQIQAAVLIANGEKDSSYVISESKELAAIVRRNHVPAETISFLNEAGGIHHLDHKVELYSRIEAFLAENLKPAGRASAPAGTP